MIAIVAIDFGFTIDGGGAAGGAGAVGGGVVVVRNVIVVVVVVVVVVVNMIIWILVMIPSRCLIMIAVIVGRLSSIVMMVIIISMLRSIVLVTITSITVPTVVQSPRRVRSRAEDGAGLGRLAITGTTETRGQAGAHHTMPAVLLPMVDRMMHRRMPMPNLVRGHRR